MVISNAKIETKQQVGLLELQGCEIVASTSLLVLTIPLTPNIDNKSETVITLQITGTQRRALEELETKVQVPKEHVM